jgi:tripartite motif-containing protein 71
MNLFMLLKRIFSLLFFIVCVAMTFSTQGQLIERRLKFIKQFGFGQLNGQLNAPSDVAVDANGNIYVAEAGSHRVQVFTGDGEFVRSFGSYGMGESQFIAPRSIAVDKNGNIYVSDNNARLQIFTNEGTFIRSIENGSMAYGIGVDNSGNIFTAWRNTDQVAMLSNTGDVLFKFGSTGAGDGQLSLPEDLTLDSNGNIYVSDLVNSRIEVFDKNGGFIRKFGSSGTDDGQFSYIGDVTVDGNGDIYVGDRIRSRIQVFSNEGVFMRSITLADGAVASGLRVDGANNRLLFADSQNHTIRIVDLTGNYIQSIGYKGKADGQFDFPDVVSFNAAGELFVFDKNNHRIQVFSADGSFLRRIDIPLSGYRFFSDITFDSERNIYFIISNQIWVYSQAGTFVRKLGIELQSAEDGHFDFPCGIFIDENDVLYVSDTQNSRVQVVTADGTFLRKIGDHDFNYSRGITLDAEGKIYVVDSGNRRVSVFNNAGTVVRTIGAQGTNNGQFIQPYGVAVDGSGKVFVTDENGHNIQVFSPEGKFLAKTGTPGAGESQFFYPRSIAIDHDGKIFLADPYNNRVQVFEYEEVEVLVGVEEQPETRGVSVSPNPSKGKMNISTNRNDLKELEICNALGQTYHHINAAGHVSSTYSVNTMDYPEGIYLVRAVFKDGFTVVHRVAVKQN